MVFHGTGPNCNHGSWIGSSGTPKVDAQCWKWLLETGGGADSGSWADSRKGVACCPSPKHPSPQFCFAVCFSHFVGYAALLSSWRRGPPLEYQSVPPTEHAVQTQCCLRADCLPSCVLQEPDRLMEPPPPLKVTGLVGKGPSLDSEHGSATPKHRGVDGGLGGKTKVCAPQIGLQFGDPLTNFIFPPRTTFLMWGGGAGWGCPGPRMNPHLHPHASLCTPA